MRARVGIDKTKSWADWVEEEDEAATQIVTPEDSKADAEPKGEPTLRLGMRLRGGDPESGGGGGGTLTEGGLPRHASAHGQDGDCGGTVQPPTAPRPLLIPETRDKGGEEGQESTGRDVIGGCGDVTTCEEATPTLYGAL